MTNWIADDNRWNLPEPPQWALQMLWNHDHMLVVLPSRFRRGYLLARRRQLSAGLGDVAMLDNKHPDTNMCAANHLLPIAPLVGKDGADPQWTAQSVEMLVAELKARDTWAITGGPNGKNPNAVWQAVEAREQLVAERDQHSLRDKFYHMARDAYRSMKARSGQRNKRASDFHGVAAPRPAPRIAP